jgi:hypothetical protein
VSELDGKRASARDYAAISAGWASMFGAVLIASRARGDEPLRSGEALPIGIATFALSKLIAKEKVDAWVREPFVEATAEGRRPKGEGLRYAMGELVTCTRCVGMWGAVGLVGLRVLRPRESRVVNAVLTASAVNDVAQAGFSWLTAKTTVTERAAAEPAPGGPGEPAHGTHHDDERYGARRA